MGCFKKKQGYQIADENHKLVEENKRNITVLLTYAEGKEEIVAKLQELVEMIKYMGPTRNKEAIKFDNKIADKIGELKIALSKNGTDVEEKCAGLVQKLKIDIAERLAISK